MRIVIVVVIVIVLGLGVGAALLVTKDDDEPKQADAAVAVLPPSPFRSGLAFGEPPSLRSSGGRLRATLVARNGSVAVSGVRVAATQTYAATSARSGRTRRGILGPTLRVQPGDLIDITLDNRLVVPDGLPGPNCADTGDSAHDAEGHGPAGRAGDPQFTNLHFHGLHVTPRSRSPYGDTVLVHLPNGKSRIRFRIPRDHDKGTFWYHAHLHECTMDQVYRGLAGLLLIGDARENLPRRLRSIRTRTMALKDVQLEKSTGAKGWQIPVNNGATNPTHRTVNGLVNPKVAIRPGETQMWRLANVSGTVWYRVALVDPAADDARDSLTVVAQDGNTLRRPVRKTSLLLPPGARHDVLVRGPRSGARVLKTLRFAQGLATFPQDTLATINVGGPVARRIAPPARMAAPEQVFPRSRGPAREFVFDFDTRPPPKNRFQATINNRVFDAEVAGATPRLGTTERWIILNKTDEWHPFHIHQDDFRVVQRGRGGPAPMPGVQDVVALPPGSPSKPSRVVIEMPFTDFAGKFVFHCHILDHEDAGMMLLVDLRRGRRGGT